MNEINQKKIEMNDSKNFQFGLQANDINILRKTPKSDLHNHFYLGGNREYIYDKTGVYIPPLKERLIEISEMHDWVNHHIESVLDGKAGRLLALEATLVQALSDGITVLEIGEDIWANEHFYHHDVLELLRVFHTAHRNIAPKIELRLQIGLSRHCSIKDLETWIEPFWESEDFYSIDLYGDEFAQPIENFKGIYRQAKAKGLILKAHVGEWGDANTVKHAVEELELNEVQHGITACQSTHIMKWLADNHIQLNICPTSNVMLSRVESIGKHPIRQLFDYGVKVTINSDDFLMFNSSVSEEYMKLYNEAVFSAQELDAIRMNGLAGRNFRLLSFT